MNTNIVKLLFPKLIYEKGDEYLAIYNITKYHLCVCVS